MQEFEIRHIQGSDTHRVKNVMKDWWDGRDLTNLVPRLFFEHFQNTSFVAEKNGEIVAFLIGFVSQSRPDEAYIHFVGVHPEYRKKGVARFLYELFFKQVQLQGCDTIRCITSPVNKGSVAFHTRIGFQIEKGDAESDGIPVTTDYDGEGTDRVLFVKSLRDE